MNKQTSEHVEQVTFLNWFSETFPGIKILSIPNGGYRHPNEAKKLKIEGVLKGVPDLFIPEWNLWIEMKRPFGYKISKEQEEFMEYAVSKCEHCHIYGIGWIDAARKVADFAGIDIPIA